MGSMIEAIPERLLTRQVRMRVILCLVILFFLLAFPKPAIADIAPPAQPPGANLQPGAGITAVRMESEKVIIEILDSTANKGLGQARVSATFHMRNLGVSAERMAVRFPLSTNDGRGNFPKIRDFQVQVGRSLTTFREVQEDDPAGFGDLVPWAAFDVTFPPGEEVIIQVEYTLDASGELPFAEFSYVFSTGAGWQGTIGSAELLVRFPYAVSELNILPTDAGSVIPGHQSAEKELRWLFTELEPDNFDNFKIQIVATAEWQKVLREQNTITKNPMDGEAWGRLGKQYKELAISSRGKGFRYFDFANDPGAQELFDLSVAAYQKALEILPEDAQWHAGYADLLGYYAHFAAFEGIDTRAEARLCLEEIRTALLLAPNDPKVLEIAQSISWMLPDGMKWDGFSADFPWLTATPTLAPTEIIPDLTGLSATPTQNLVQPTTTIEKVVEVDSMPEKIKVPLCGSVLLAPLGVFFSLHLKKKFGVY